MEDANTPSNSNAETSADSGVETLHQEEAQSAAVPEFAEVSERVVKRTDMNTNRLRSVSVPVWAELGRVEMQIGNILQLGEGSVVSLDRAVGDPVDLVSQGVKLARGEVIVVDDCFAIRIREILSEK